MTTYDFMRKNKDKQPKKEKRVASVLQGTDGNFYSYGYHYPLLFKIDGIWFVNERGYSNSTSKHISWARGLADYCVVLPYQASIRYQTPAQLRKLIRDSLREELKQKIEDLDGLKRQGTMKAQRIKNDIKDISDTLMQIWKKSPKVK